MHDLLEGGSIRNKTRSSKTYIFKMFRFRKINQRIISYDYSYLDSKNRPLRLDNNSNRIGQKAAQAWCLIRHLPIIIGDLIVTSDAKKFWELILLLLEILNIVFCRNFSEAILFKLDSLIITHHSKFKELFPENRLIPKHHFMCHYSYVIRQTGPLISLWTMRFEGKHNYFVQLANHTKNFRNISYTLSIRHQQYAAVMSKNIVLNELKVENILSIKLCQFSNPFDAIELLRKVNGFEKCDEETEICTTNQIWFNNYNYKHNYIVCFGHDPVFPKFGVIVEFLITDEKTCYLLLNKLEVQYFDRHYFSYRGKLKHDGMSYVM
ncbi:uncharacterized protein LOC118436458 isoform X2 [Folsomia candida]|nr:uncharacterized protein LOC118436458 isoform X2 [Folsomia candida]